MAPHEASHPSNPALLPSPYSRSPAETATSLSLRLIHGSYSASWLYHLAVEAFSVSDEKRIGRAALA